eukprot:2575919-Rhodomonas_salina.1
MECGPVRNPPHTSPLVASEHRGSFANTEHVSSRPQNPSPQEPVQSCGQLEPLSSHPHRPSPHAGGTGICQGGREKGEGASQITGGGARVRGSVEQKMTIMAGVMFPESQQGMGKRA